eukprot:4806469-Pyramimonas_sp.AAC.1
MPPEVRIHTRRLLDVASCFQNHPLDPAQHGHRHSIVHHHGELPVRGGCALHVRREALELGEILCRRHALPR